MNYNLNHPLYSNNDLYKWPYLDSNAQVIIELSLFYSNLLGTLCSEKLFDILILHHLDSPLIIPNYLYNVQESLF